MKRKKQALLSLFGMLAGMVGIQVSTPALAFLIARGPSEGFDFGIKLVTTMLSNVSAFGSFSDTLFAAISLL